LDFDAKTRFGKPIKFYHNVYETKKLFENCLVVCGGPEVDRGLNFLQVASNDA
jgi:hypothetical protein